MEFLHWLESILLQLFTYADDKLSTGGLVILVVGLVLAHAINKWDNDPRSEFRIFRFFMTNDHEDMSKAVLALFAVIFAWGYILQVMDKTIDDRMLLLYMTFAFGLPAFNALLRTINNIFGKQTLPSDANGTCAKQPSA